LRFSKKPIRLELRASEGVANEASWVKEMMIITFPPIKHVFIHIRLTRNLLNLAIFEHVTTVNGLELQVTGDLGVKEDLGELAARHDELGDQVHVPV
jgi:hypothetical protein